MGGGGSATSSVSICTVISSAAPHAPLRSRARTESSYSPARVGVQVNWVVSSELAAQGDAGRRACPRRAARPWTARRDRSPSTRRSVGPGSSASRSPAPRCARPARRRRRHLVVAPSRQQHEGRGADDEQRGQDQREEATGRSADHRVAPPARSWSPVITTDPPPRSTRPFRPLARQAYALHTPGKGSYDPSRGHLAGPSRARLRGISRAIGSSADLPVPVDVHAERRPVTPRGLARGGWRPPSPPSAGPA